MKKVILQSVLAAFGFGLVFGLRRNERRNNRKVEEKKQMDQEHSVKALAIYSEFHDTFWSFRYALKFTHRKASSPPLGLLTIGAMIPEAWEKRLVDMNMESLHDAKRWSNLWKLHGKHFQVLVRRHHFETSFIW